MNENFKTKLIGLCGNYNPTAVEEELEKIIRFGAWGEGGENYYLFLYRDFYRDSTYYGSCIFLDKVDPLENPVTITGVEQNGKERVRNVFVKAALYFLKNSCQDTMTVSGNARTVFALSKELINAHIGEAKSPGATLDQFDYDFLNQEVQFKEIEPRAADKIYKSRALEENLKKLNPEVSPEVPIINSPKIKANLGLCLVSRHLDLSGEKQHFFQPVILPITENNSRGKPQKPPKPGANHTEYEWLDPVEALENFYTAYRFMDAQPGNPRLKAEMMNHIFFRSLAEEIFKLPDDLTFYQEDSSRDYFPLKKITFNRIIVRFAPSLKKDSVYRFYLTFSSADGLTLDAGDNFEIVTFAKMYYFRFSAGGEEMVFAVPDTTAGSDTTSSFYRFCDFLAAQREGFYFNELEAVLTALRSLESEVIHIQSVPLKKYELHFLPTPILNLFHVEEALTRYQYLEIQFDYRERLESFLAQHPDKAVCTVPRAEEFENRFAQMLDNDPLLTRQMDFHDERKTVYHYYYFRDNDSLAWLIRQGKLYLEKGIKIYSMKWKRFIADANTTLTIRVSHDIDWLEFKPYIVDPVSGLPIDIDLDAEDLPPGMVIDKKGMLHLVTGKEIERLAELYRYAEPHGGGFRIPSRNFVLLRRLYDEKMEDYPELKEALDNEERLKEFERIPDYPLSQNFKGQLRGYQFEGFKWLNFLRDYRFSGCLADDMGLGKTVQTLALLHTLKDKEQLRTSLLVVPVSAIPNWEAEIERFSPSLSYYRHTGSNRDVSTAGWMEKDIVITSYATMRNDIELLADFEFDYIILDESQNIKNFSSQVALAAKVLKGRNRLALSGTPIENNSMELWSLFDFLMPGFLGSYRWFNRQLGVGIEKDRDPAKTDLLRRMIFPFILRRKKQEVEKDLPEKIEIVSSLQMDDEQAKLYAETARYYREKLDKEIEEKGVAGSSIKILEGMLRLRQLCLFPHLLDEKHAPIPSVKFDNFKELLEEIAAERHKVLVFSQFVQVLKRLREYCAEVNLAYSYIDGSVKVNERKQAVNSFQEDEHNRVFLLSLKAGGVALNLTAADYVIIFDPWWNPAVEAQAIDRSHRIGQTKKVMVYRLVVKDTIEEKMLILQDKKKTLMDDLIVSDSQAFKDLSKKDILDLFR